jgi:hypothetical protein
LSVTHDLGDKAGIAQTLALLGDVVRDHGDDARAMTLYEESLGLAHELDNATGIAEMRARLVVGGPEQADRADRRNEHPVPRA